MTVPPPPSAAPPEPAGSADPRLARALASLRGLSVGDALGSRFLVPAHYPLLGRRVLPEGDWRWTGDTEMACSVVAVLAAHGRIDQDALAASFAARQHPDRGYGPVVNRLLAGLRDGGDWRELASALFNGQGTWGSGAATRAAPIGAWYADDPEQATHQAEISAYPTHQHREAVVGAMAVAAAAALVASPAGRPTPEALLDGVLALIPRSAVEAGLRRARDMLDYGDPGTVAAVLGRGRRTGAHDTVPFALWAAARGLGDYPRAFWETVRVGGDTDTTCAIVGGVVAVSGDSGAPPGEWRDRTDPLPSWVLVGA
ncbi:ADP-ribosylglycohydrolase family protein [Streptomyces sp. JNUCC 64]